MEKNPEDTNGLLKKIYEMVEAKLDEIIDMIWNIGTLLEERE